MYVRLRIVCMTLALMMVTPVLRATDYYLVGNFNSWDTSDTYKFTVNETGTTATLTLTGAQINSAPTQFLIKAVESSSNSWYLKNSSTSVTTVTVNGDPVTASSYYNKTGGNYSVSGLSTSASTTYTFTLTANANDINNSKLRITSSSTGGGTSTSGDESADNSDTESKTAGYGVPDNFGGVILRYNSSEEPTKGNLYDWKDYFSVAYLTPDSKGFKSTFAPYFSNLIKDVASHSEKEDGWAGYVVSMSQSSHPLSLTAYGNPKFLIGNWSNSTSWSVGSELNYTKPYLDKIYSSYAGMLDFPLHTFIYNIEQGKYSDAMAKGWQALTYLSQIAPTNTNRASVVGSGRNSDALYNRLGVTFVNNDKVNDITGVENIKKAYAVILTSPGTPVVNYSDLTNSDLNNDILRLIKIRQWAGVKNTSTFMTSEDKNYNNAYDYHIQGDFAELKVVVGDEAYVANYEKNGNNGETTGGSADRNGTKFGGDGYNYTLLDEGTGWRVWYRNNNNANAIHVALSPESGYKTGTVTCTGQVIGIAGSGERKFAYTTDGTAPVLDASNTKTVTYTWNSTTQSGKIDDFSSTHSTVVANDGYVTVIAQAIKDGVLTGAIDTVTYRFNDYVPLNVKLTPATATVAYAASLTPKVEVTETDATTRTYAFTIDGTNPTIDPTTGEGTGTTVVRKYTYDKVVPTDDVYTFFMSSDNKLTYIGTDKKEHTLDGNTVTVKAQAVQTVKNRLEGDIATGTYVFKTAGTAPAASYTISVVNDNNTGLASINKATATVTVLNKATNSDDGVDVYYTTDGSDPVAAGNPNSRLVRDRKITVYSIDNPDDINRIRVAIAGSKESDEDDGTTHASCTYDVTCSTSEGGYINYRDGYSKGKTLGGDGHIVVYVQPWSSDDKVSVATGDNPGVGRVPYIYAYENIDKDGVEVSKSLTNGHHIIDVTKDVALVQTDNPDEQWYYVDLVPDKGYKEVNVCMGYCDQDNSNTYTLTAATVANARNDMFLKYDVATGKIEDVTHAYTGDHFYTTGAGGTKSENANPGANEHFFLAQVPVAWVINGNEVKVEKDNTVYSDATVVTQGAAETSDLSRVCKITVPPSLDENTPLTIRPYNGSEASKVGFEVNYKNGGYYFYESATHNTKEALLVFAADADGDSDKREYGHRDVNHVLDTNYGDYTQYLTPNWTYSPDTKTKEITVDDNWNGKTATVNTIAAGTTISQDVEGLEPGVYTVQMIVRGESNAKGTLQLQGSEYTDEKGKTVGSTTGSDSKTFAGYDAQGTITIDGRVERLLKTETKNGWQKLETTATVGDEGKLTVSLKAEGEELQLSDVTLLWNANTSSKFSTVWTKAPTSSTVTEYNLTDRKNANDFSFFDRGDNSNAVIYADKNTVLGMSPNTYNVAVPTEYTTSAKGGIVFHSESHGTPNAKDFNEAKGYKLAFDDNPGDWTNDFTWGTSKKTSWNSFSWNRKFTGTASGSGERNTICLPFNMSAEQIKGIFGDNAKVYKIKSVNTDKLTVEGTEVTETYPNTPYILELPEAKDGVSYDGTHGTLTTWISNAAPYKTKIGDQGDFVGVYKYTNFTSKSDGTYDYYCYDAERNGMFNFFSKEGADFKPFRAYLEISHSAGSKPYYYFVIDEGGTTAIDSVSAATLTDDAPVYDLQGQLVRRAGQHTQLPQGLYIQKGRKFVQQ